MSSSTPTYHHQDRFFGRDEVVTEVETILRDGIGRVGLYGAPGVGKSRLAARVARAWRGRGEAVAFVDGRAAVDEASFLDALVLALELPPVTELDRRAVITQLIDALAERSGLLVVLDDVEKLIDEVAELLRPILRAVNISLLLTSRSALKINGVSSVHLRPLSAATAMQLFEHRAKRARPDFDASQVAPGILQDLVQRLDHLPLAIELAAPRLTILTPEALLARLDRRFQILRPGHNPGNISQMALGEAIAISWEMLDDLQRSTLTQCAVFAGGFTLDAAEAVVDMPEADDWVGDVLQSLILQSLVSTSDAGGIRFHMLESIRDYARDRGESTQLRAAYERHARHFQDCALAWSQEVSGPDGGQALAKLCAESSNLLAAVEELSSTEPESALEVLCNMEPTFAVRGLLGSYLERIDRCRQAISTTDCQARTALTRASLLGSGGRLQEALDAVDQALETLKNTNSSQEPSLSEVLLCRGRILRDLGRLEEARTDWQRAFDESDEPFWRFQVQNELGLLELNRARFGADDEEDALERGAEMLGKSYELASRHTHALYRVRATVGWALALHETGETARGLRLLVEERNVQTDTGYQNGELLCAHHIAILEFYSGDYDRALEIAGRVDRGLAEAGLAARRARNTSYRAVFANAAGKLDEAADHISRALDASEHTGQEITALVADVQGLQVAWERGDEDAARAHLNRARIAAKSVGSPGHASFLGAYESFLTARDDGAEIARSRCEQAIAQLKNAAEYRRPASAPRGEVVAQAWRAIVELSCAEAHIEDTNWDRLYNALESADAVMESPADPLTAVARRHAQIMAKKVRRDHGLPKQRPAHILRMLDDGQAFQLDSGEKVDLANRDPLRRILVELAELANSGQQSADLDAVVAAGWPEEELEQQSAANRVYATIRMLRNLGLKDVLITDNGGYRLADDVLVL